MSVETDQYEKEKGVLYGLGLLLIEEIKELNKSTKEWTTCKDYMMPKIFSSGILKKLPMLVRLAVAVIIINSEAVDLFRIAFLITCEWEEVANVIPLLIEIRRFAALYYVEKGFTDHDGIKMNTYNSDKARLNLENAFLVPGKSSETYVKTTVLRERIIEVQKEMSDLIDCLHSVANPTKQLETYKRMYPLSQLTVDYNKWAKGLLTRRSDLMTLEKLGCQIETKTKIIIRDGQCSDGDVDEVIDSLTEMPKTKHKRGR